jgi:hypothetical protein
VQIPPVRSNGARIRHHSSRDHEFDTLSTCHRSLPVFFMYALHVFMHTFLIV